MAHATVYEDQTFPYGLIGPVDILWRPVEQHLEDRTVWLRIHPSIYQPTMDLLRGLISSSNDEASSSSKVHQPSIVINDLRGEVDSFEVMGPKSARILRRILRLSKTEGKDKQKVSLRLVRFETVAHLQFFDSLRGVQGLEIPDSMVAGLLVHDPRLM